MMMIGSIGLSVVWSVRGSATGNGRTRVLIGGGMSLLVIVRKGAAVGVLPPNCALPPKVVISLGEVVCCKVGSAGADAD